MRTLIIVGDLVYMAGNICILITILKLSKLSSKALALRYRDKHGLVTPEEIQHMYTPSNDGSWAYSVNHFMQILQ